LLEADPDAEYAEIIDIDLNQITEPLLACPNDPDDIKPLSEVAGVHVDEVFIGSCMTNIGHYRAAGKVLEKNPGAVPTRLWIVPPTKMDAQQLTEEGYYSIFGKVGARTEVPGCSLCMGNQARVADGATVVSTSTRNFPNRMGKDSQVYLASAELSAVSSVLGKIPSVREYLDAVKSLEPMAEDIYQYLNFNQMDDYQSIAETVIPVQLS
jgi:aconitate hydratase 2/2-methylisocitrate dehydratase